ncbi:gamma-glutamylcyclotransferase family protein [Novipirellula artificiosorum]|uniref:gamma-glutamylcyclotransferase family protein n=1 Tax=Novipirellula artificiosorum TaxID=2528016 RepID=UPI001E4F28AD|nr:gamma-glutamylcyclotransferase family protein [Novipirellula artificiosorum]
MLSVFVYGTLMRGQCRQSLWPRVPASVDAGWVFGSLFDREDYPAMRSGPDRVLGECWTFAADDMKAVLRALDEIEAASDPPCEGDLYHRVLIEVFSHADQSLGTAFAYHYATDPVEDGFAPIVPDSPSAFVRWPLPR